MSNPQFTISTTFGNIDIELFENEAPITAKNFKDYVADEFYDGTIFHRVIPGFMVQCGGFDASMKEKVNKAPIKNEATNGRQNLRGALAMARTSVVDSATSQFFINLVDNDFLNFKGPSPQTYGYAVFGQVTSGMDVVDEIAQVATGTKGHHGDVPLEPVVIESIRAK